MSTARFVSPSTRFEAADSKATKRPLALIAGMVLLPFPWLPELSTLTRSVRLVRSGMAAWTIDGKSDPSRVASRTASLGLMALGALIATPREEKIRPSVLIMAQGWSRRRARNFAHADQRMLRPARR